MEIISYKEAPHDAKYLAEIEVYYKRIFYRRIRVMLSKQGHHFINLPVYGEDDGKGGKRWIQFWEWTKDEDTEFKRECLLALHSYLNKQPSGYSQPSQSPTMSAPQQTQQPNARPYPGTYQPDLNDCPF